jgi:23S rRNA pseudouridine1911/1915/1917 synthase
LVGEASVHPGRKLTLSVPASLHGQRLDRALAQMMPSVSRSYLKKLAKDGCCWVNNAVAKPGDTVHTGDVVTLALTEEISPPCRPVPGPLDVRYEDDAVLVVLKPTGLVSHPAKGHVCDTLLNRVVAYLLEEIERGWSRPHLISRLDKQTSGLILVAKTPRAYRSLQRQMDRRSIQRRYLAVVWGEMDKPTGRFEGAIGRERNGGPRMIVTENGKSACTHYRVRRTFRVRAEKLPKTWPAAVSVVSVRLATGRTHQVRVHFANAGHPVLGDDLYGWCDTREIPDAMLRTAVSGLGGCALHAGVLLFEHPLTGEPMRVVAAPPQSFLELLRWLHTNEKHASGREVS